MHSTTHTHTSTHPRMISQDWLIFAVRPDYCRVEIGIFFKKSIFHDSTIFDFTYRQHFRVNLQEHRCTPITPVGTEKRALRIRERPSVECGVVCFRAAAAPRLSRGRRQWKRQWGLSVWTLTLFDRVGDVSSAGPSGKFNSLLEEI